MAVCMMSSLEKEDIDVSMRSSCEKEDLAV